MIAVTIPATIPEDKSAAVTRGLEQAFGTTTVDEVERMTRGLSSDLVFRIDVKGTPYLLRIIMGVNEQLDPARIFACMRAASDGGLTPRVLYTSLEDGVSITDFVVAEPLPRLTALELLPGTLRTLHGLPRFPKEFNYATSHRYFHKRLRGAGVLRQDEMDEVFAAYDEICACYPRVEADMVPSHMDLKPDNILFEGGRIWLVDWQSAFVNDRYFDLAVIANYLVETDADETACLAGYFGRLPGEVERARFFLMRQALHMLAAAVFLMIGPLAGPLPEVASLPTFEEFHRRVWAGGVDLARRDEQVLAGMVHWRRLLANVREPRFADALRKVSTAQDFVPLLPRVTAE